MQGFSGLPVFVAVVENAGFSTAARVLGISKSAVSKRINELEKHLGVRLLHRTTRRLSLTEAGERYYEHAVQAVQAGSLAQDSVTQLQDDPQGVLRINAPMSFGRLHVAPHVPEFLRRYSKLELDLVMDDRVQDIISGGFDAAIRAGNLSDSSLVARRLAPCRHVFCASPGYIERAGEPLKPADLPEHNCVLYSYSQDINEWTFFGQFEPETVKVSGNYRVNNSEALLQALCEDVGVGRLPTFVAGEAIRAGRLRPLLTDYRYETLSIYAVMPERLYMPAKLRVFLEYMAERFGGEEPYWDRQPLTTAPRI